MLIFVGVTPGADMFVWDEGLSEHNTTKLQNKQQPQPTNVRKREKKTPQTGQKGTGGRYMRAVCGLSLKSCTVLSSGCWLCVLHAFLVALSVCFVCVTLLVYLFVCVVVVVVLCLFCTVLSLASLVLLYCIARCEVRCGCEVRGEIPTNHKNTVHHKRTDNNETTHTEENREDTDNREEQRQREQKQRTKKEHTTRERTVSGTQDQAVQWVVI